MRYGVFMIFKMRAMHQLNNFESSFIVYKYLSGVQYL